MHRLALHLAITRSSLRRSMLRPARLDRRQLSSILKYGRLAGAGDGRRESASDFCAALVGE
jgi:hypothetical protein